MRIPEFIDISEYFYDLPEDRIAKYPLEQRDHSKLLYFNHGSIRDHVFHELPAILSGNYQLVFNDTRVIQARIQFNKASGSGIEIFLLEPFTPADYQLSFGSSSQCSWKCLVGNAKKWKDEILEKKIFSATEAALLQAEKINREENYFIIRFTWNNKNLCFSEILEISGLTPIPPYLNREAEESDNLRYQTIYSNYEGSVAAPTAGLHFSDEVLEKLSQSGVKQTHLTLHVGAGTFVPVKVENARDHEMHMEHIYINRQSISSLLHTDKKIIAVGTTSVRTLESLYYIACKLKSGYRGYKELFLDQWDAYEIEPDISRDEALETILSFMDLKNTDTLKLTTRIMISPGYTFRMADGIITNFHQPSSTLLLLISAFIGEDWKKVYDHALKNNYRFLSYGDSSLLIP
ncbi:MAG: S-adenosylmethionine:tRNA ribosyltransferase-isomerase [Bacteroidales bacterium]|nr:S-adenosylmethionine:tRNA ribosyltransferase-isomerase [Bacteroidales bacterium]